MEGSSPTKKSVRQQRYGQELQSMLYTFGDTRIPHPETISVLEDLLYTELCSIIRHTAQIAVGRNYRTAHLSPEDLCFTLRADAHLCTRLRDFLAWREVRRNVKGNNEEVVPPLEATATGEERGQKRPMRFPWDYSSTVLELIPKEVLSYYEDFPVSPLTRSLDALDHSSNYFTNTTDRSYFDAVTRSMSPSAYLEYSECRQASFTFKKLKKFREWLQISQLTDYRLGDDFLELLGFVAWELVQKWAMRALALQAEAKIGGKRNEHFYYTTSNSKRFKGPFQQTETIKTNEDESKAALLPHFLLGAYKEGKQKKDQFYYQRFFL